MGCTTSSKRVKVRGGSVTDQTLVQEESQSFRCNVKAVRYALKDPTVRLEFQTYLLSQSSVVEFLSCFLELELMKSQLDDELIPSINVLLAKYQLMYEQSLRINAYTTHTPGVSIHAVWGKLRRLSTLDLNGITRAHLMRAVLDAQNQMLSELAVPFEEFLESAETNTRVEKIQSPRPSPHFSRSPPATAGTSATTGTAAPAVLSRRLTPRAASKAREHSFSLFSSSSLTKSNSEEFSSVF